MILCRPSCRLNMYIFQGVGSGIYVKQYSKGSTQIETIKLELCLPVTVFLAKFCFDPQANYYPFERSEEVRRRVGWGRWGYVYFKSCSWESKVIYQLLL